MYYYKTGSRLCSTSFVSPQGEAKLVFPYKAGTEKVYSP